jgi:hypothetical protein
MPDTFKIYGSAISSTNATAVLSATSGTSIVNAINVANVSTQSTASFSVTVTSAGGTFTVIPGVTLATHAYTQVLASPLAVPAGEEIAFSASTADCLQVVISVLERTP